MTIHTLMQMLCLLLTIPTCYGVYFGFQTCSTSNHKIQFNAIRLTLQWSTSRYQCHTYPTELNTIYACDTSDEIECSNIPSTNENVVSGLQIENYGLNTVDIDRIFVHGMSTSIDMNYFCPNASFVEAPCFLKDTISINSQIPFYLIELNNPGASIGDVYFSNTNQISCQFVSYTNEQDILQNTTDMCVRKSSRPFLDGIYKYSSWNTETNSAIYYSILNHKYLYNSINDVNKQLMASDMWDPLSKNDQYCMRTLCYQNIEIEMVAEFHMHTNCSQSKSSKLDRIWWMFNTERNSVEIMSLSYSNKLVTANPNSNDNILECCKFFEKGEWCKPVDLQDDEYINGYRIFSDDIIKALYFYTNKNKTHLCSSHAYDATINNYTDSGIMQNNNMYLDTLEFDNASIFSFKYSNCLELDTNSAVMELEHSNMEVNPCNFIPTQTSKSITFAIKTPSLIHTILTLTLFWDNLKYQCNVLNDLYQDPYYSCDTSIHESVTKCENAFFNPVKYGLQIDEPETNNGLEIEYISVTEIAESVNRYMVTENLHFNNSFKNHLITFNLDDAISRPTGWISLPVTISNQNVPQTCVTEITANPSSNPSAKPTEKVTIKPTESPSNIIIKNHELIEIEWITFKISNVDVSCGGSIGSVSIKDESVSEWMNYTDYVNEYYIFNMLNNSINDSLIDIPISIRIIKYDHDNHEIKSLIGENIITSLNGSEQFNFGSNFCKHEMKDEESNSGSDNKAADHTIAIVIAINAAFVIIGFVLFCFCCGPDKNKNTRATKGHVKIVENDDTDTDIIYINDNDQDEEKKSVDDNDIHNHTPIKFDEKVINENHLLLLQNDQSL